MSTVADQIVVLAEDPGGANLVASYILENDLKDRCHYVLTGPAIKLFEATLGPLDLEEIDVLASVVPESSMLICATGGNYRPVINAIHQARTLGVKSVAYLDHWTYYAIRFGSSGDWIENLPDEVWLTDEHALEQARLERFPEDRLKVVGDPYLRRNVERIQSLRDSGTRDGFRVLYMSEVLEEAPPHEGPTAAEYRYDGHSILNDIAHAVKATASDELELVVRLHPSESRDKYDRAISELSHQQRVSKSFESDIAVDIANSDIVIGAQTAALVLALAAGVPAVSYIPAGGLPCQLPQEDLKRITDPRYLRLEIARQVHDQ